MDHDDVLTETDFRPFDPSTVTMWTRSSDFVFSGDTNIRHVELNEMTSRSSAAIRQQTTVSNKQATLIGRVISFVAYLMQ